MQRREKNTGQVTIVKGRAKPYRATTIDARGKAHSKFFKTQTEANAYLRQINNQIAQKKNPHKKDVTIYDYAAVFLQEKKKGGMKPRSYQTLMGHVDLMCDYLDVDMLGEIDSDQVQHMLNKLNNAGYSHSVMSKVKQTVCAILKKAAAQGVIDSNPVIDAQIPTPNSGKLPNKEKSRKPGDNYLHRDEMANYERECRRTYTPGRYTKNAGQEILVHPAAYKLLFIMHTGLREGEALALEWSDYDQNSKTITVNKNVVYYKGQKIVQTPKTNSGVRVIVLNKSAFEDVNTLKRQFDEQTEELARREKEELEAARRQFVGAELTDAEKKIRKKYVEYNKEHKYICGSSSFPFGSSAGVSLGQTHRKICKAIALQHSVTVHGLRHTYVTHSYINHKNDADFDLETFSRSIGHKSARTTMEIYTHLNMTEAKNIQRSEEDLKDF